jgi:hypothetical protein
MQAQRQFQPSKLKGPWHSSRAEPPGPPRRVAGLTHDGAHRAMTARANVGMHPDQAYTPPCPDRPLATPLADIGLGLGVATSHGSPVRPHDQPQSLAALTIATMPALIASGSSGQASTTAAKSGSSEAARCPCAANRGFDFRKLLVGL